MKPTKKIELGNSFREEKLEEIIKELENGETVEMFVDCIGFTLNNTIEERYKEELIKKYNKKIQFEQVGSSKVYWYNVKLK